MSNIGQAKRGRLFGLLLILAIFVLGFFTLRELNKSNINLPTLNKNIQPGYYSVEEVFDGDTISVDMNGNIEKVRFIGVDTPETHDPDSPVQCFGKTATDYTKSRISNGSVKLVPDPDNTNRDRYDRLLRYVYLEDGTLLNSEIIKAGYGFAYTYFPFSKAEEFKAYEKQAKSELAGLWGNCEIKVDSQGINRTAPAD